MKAYELLQDPKNWTRYAYAHDETGAIMPSDSPTTVRWCVRAALLRCYKGAKYQDRVKAIRDVVGDLEKWNDDRMTSHAESSICSEKWTSKHENKRKRMKPDYRKAGKNLRQDLRGRLDRQKWSVEKALTTPVFFRGQI